MNGRVYDPDLGRFLSADPYIQSPANPQNFNRYSYVNNNPLSYTDPSGFFFKKLFKKIGKLFVKGIKSLFKQFVRGLKNTFSPQNLLSAAAFVGCNAVAPGSGSACAAAAAGGYTAANGGSIIEVLHSAIATYNSFNTASTGQLPSGVAENTETIARFAEAIEDDLSKRNDNAQAQDNVRRAILGSDAGIYGGNKFLNGAATVAFNRTLGLNSKAKNKGPEIVLDEGLTTDQTNVINKFLSEYLDILEEILPPGPGRIDIVVNDDLEGICEGALGCTTRTGSRRSRIELPSDTFNRSPGLLDSVLIHEFIHASDQLSGKNDDKIQPERERRTIRREAKILERLKKEGRIDLSDEFILKRKQDAFIYK